MASEFATRALKWVGAASAVLSLGFAVQQLVTRASGYVRENRELTDLVEIARQQASRQDFVQSWASLSRAATLGGEAAVEGPRAEIAMAWLRDGRPGPDKPFSTLTDPVIPALDRALLRAEGSQRADILAHLGWATFLQLRDGISGDPEARYREALAIDASNPYANAMLGHWRLWRGERIESARPFFATALAAGRERAYARQMQLTALRTRGQDADAELMQVINDMRLHDEPLEPRVADYVYWVYSMWFGTPGREHPPLPLAMTDLAASFEHVARWSPKAGDSVVVTERIRQALK